MKRANGFKCQYCEPELKKPLVQPWWVQPKTVIKLKPTILLKIFKGTPYYFPKYPSVKHPKFKLHLKASHTDQECPLLLCHFNSALKSLTTSNLIQEISYQSPWNIF